MHPPERAQSEDSYTLGAPEGWSVRHGELKVRTVTHSEHSRAQSEDSYTLGAPGSSTGLDRDNPGRIFFKEMFAQDWKQSLGRNL